MRPTGSGAGKALKCLCQRQSPGHQFWAAGPARRPLQARHSGHVPLVTYPAPPPTALSHFQLYMKNSLFHGQQKGATSQRSHTQDTWRGPAPPYEAPTSLSAGLTWP